MSRRSALHRFLPRACPFAALALLVPGAARAAAAPSLADYNVVWTSPGANSSESMPCGGGDIGLNVWVENGDLLIYLARSGTFDDLNGLPKLGRLRVRLAPNPLLAGAVFRQELKLREGYVEIIAEKDGLRAKIEVWVDVFRPVVHVEIESSAPTAVTAAYEGWRLADREQRGRELDANRSWYSAPHVPIVRADQVDFRDDAVRFVHRNAGFSGFDLVVAQQELEGIRDQLWNPLEHLTFGGVLTGRDMIAAGTTDGQYASTPFRAWQLASRAPAASHDLRAVLHVANTTTLAEWDAGLRELENDAATNRAAARRRTLAWWEEFWERSYIIIDADRPDPASPVWQVGRNYQLFRYQLGCNARGAWPTKFNGGLFTFDSEYVDPRATFTPDHRRWGGGSFTAQNQRLVHWPMLKSGDFDLLRPQFEFYRRALGNAEARSREYWGIDGASFTEQIENFGLPVAYEYGWRRQPGVERGLEDNAWVNYQWDTAFEFCRMILDVHRYTGRDVREYLPLIESCLRFYDAYYQRETQKRTGRPLGEDGRLVIFPGTALETYKDALNPTPTIAALRGVLTGLLALPDNQLDAARREHWQTMLARLPAIGTRELNGHRVIAPAWEWSRIQNVELPQLYTVFPWGIHGVGRPDLDLAIATWRHGIDRPDQKQIISWHQDAIFCARLGLTAEAADLTVQKLRDAARRFPTWWGPGHDWVPDHNWGGSGMIGLQEMLLQTDGDKIHLLPAWPKNWNVRFKLHAPQQTVIEAVVTDGRLVELHVTPQRRALDIVAPSAP